MAVFSGAHDYWKFAQSVKRKARYVHGDEVRDFLARVIETSQSRRKTLEKGRVLFRAQRDFVYRTIEQDGEEFEIEDACPPERMVPKAELVGEGRVNSRGIPCLYLASNSNTAMAEVRPWLGAYISLAQFEVVRDCEIIDCSTDKKRFHLIFTATGELQEPEAADREQYVWGDIAEAFSKPVSQHEPHSDYVPTQILAEAFGNSGYAGLMYKSLLDEKGYNIALFDTTSARLTACVLYKADSISFKFEQSGNPYFVRTEETVPPAEAADGS